MEQESIHCDGCECWLHQQFMCISTLQYFNFSQPYLQFFCKQCVSNANGFSFVASLSHIAQYAPDDARMRYQAESEFNLLKFYNVLLPHVYSISDRNTVHDKLSEDLPLDYSPSILDQFVPANVAGDGNCLFCSVSRALYGNQVSHVQLCLLVKIKVLLNPVLCMPYGILGHIPY